MAFDQPTRNRLASFVGKARTLLTEEFTRQLQHEYGLDPAAGEIADLGKLSGLDDARRATAGVLRETLAHYLGCQQFQMWFSSAWGESQAHQHEVEEVVPAHKW